VKQILFVDDEPMLLNGLKRTLHSMKHEWNMVFACGGQEALKALEQSSCDVVVSDMRMPGMDGVELLSEVQQRYPHIIRIILSGQSDKDMILRSIGVTHQFLAKPFDSKQLQATIQRACTLQELVRNDGLRSLVGNMKAIPSLPKLYMEIKEVVESETCSMKAIADIIGRDPGMTAKIMQLVNSAYFGLAKNVSTVELAVNFVGVDIIQSLTLSSHVFSQFPSDKARIFHIERLGAEGMRTGLVARCIARAAQRPPIELEQAFIAGLLHDTGMLMLAADCSQRYSAVLAGARARNQKIWEAEQAEFGATHAEVGAYLLGLWGFHEAIIEAIALHHRPGDSKADSFTPLTAVHVADALLQEQYGQAMHCLPSTLNWAYLDRLKLADWLPQWGIMAWNVGRTLAA